MAADRARRPPRRFHRSLSTNTSTHLVTRRLVEDTGLEIIYISAERWTFNDKTVTNHGPLILAIGSEVRSFLSTSSHAWLLLIVIKRAKVPTRDFYLLFFILFFYFFPRHSSILPLLDASTIVTIVRRSSRRIFSPFSRENTSIVRSKMFSGAKNTRGHMQGRIYLHAFYCKFSYTRWL